MESLAWHPLRVALARVVAWQAEIPFPVSSCPIVITKIHLFQTGALNTFFRWEPVAQPVCELREAVAHGSFGDHPRKRHLQCLFDGILLSFSFFQVFLKRRLRSCILLLPRAFQRHGGEGRVAAQARLATATATGNGATGNLVRYDPPPPAGDLGKGCTGRQACQIAIRPMFPM